jgi:hypothetical protein
MPTPSFSATLMGLGLGLLATTPTHAETPFSVAQEAAYFLWGPEISADALTILQGDITCDGTAETVLQYVPPDTSRLALAVIEEGRNLEEIANGWFDFGGVGELSLCGAAKPVEMVLFNTLDQDSVLDLTGYTAPPLCHQTVRLDDGLCDPLWIFTRRRDDGLLDLVVGRH